MKFPRFLQIAALVLLAAGAQPVGAAVWEWSLTAANNATADSKINWAEGMSPSSVNDSARAMMAALAAQRDDISGLLATSGTATAYTVTTKQGVQTPTPVDGQMISVRFHATNGVNSTLSADGGTARAIWSAPSTPVPPGTLIAGNPYVLVYNAGYTAWQLRGVFADALSVPLGTMLDFTGDSSPNSNFLLPAGQCISRTVYAAYFAMIGTRFSACDGTSTFGVPDMRGRNGVALDNLGGGATANRLVTGSCAGPRHTVGGSCGTDVVTLTTSQMPSHNHGGLTSNMSATTNPSHAHSYNAPSGILNGDVGATIFPVAGSASATTGGANIDHYHLINSDGGGNAHDNMPPTMMVSKLLRIL